MTFVYTVEERKWLDSSNGMKRIIDGCPSSIREPLERKLNQEKKLRAMMREFYGKRKYN